MKKRILSILLCLIMVVGLLPTAAFASGGEVHECSFCSNVYYGDDVSEYLCENCGACVDDCWSDMHCYGCGACYAEAETQWCEDCTLCLDCQLDRLDHCIECGNCYFDNPDELCGECHRCDSCAYICLYCGICEDCWDETGDEMHCPICGECYEVAGTAECGGHHCAYCCEFCEQCNDWETCLTDEPDKEFCDECGLCMDCCMDNRNAASGCSEFCIESSEYEYHYCEDCGDCFCEKDQCGYCGLCTECCAANSECTNSDPMCVEDGDYEDHFCPECGECMCEGWDELCEFCGLCPDCCKAEIASERDSVCTDCDGFKCKEDPDFIEHMESVHEETITHIHRFSVLWSMDGQYHWHDCVACADGKNTEGSMTVDHTLNSQGICTTCGYKTGATVYFTTQPRDVHTTVGDSDDYDRVTDEHGKTHPYEIRSSFRAKAYGKGLSYQWYRVRVNKDGTGTELGDDADDNYSYISGANTPTLTVCVDNEACFLDTYFYCVATDKDGNTARSRSAKMIASHRYTYALEELSDEGGKYIYVKSTTSGSTGYNQRKLPASPGHRWYCCGEHSDDRPSLGGVKPHHFGGTPYCTVQAAYTAKAAAAGEFTTFYQYRCTDCGFAKYVEKHEHRMVVAAPEEVGGEELFTKTSHPLICEVAGCDELGSAFHNWSFHTAQWPSNGINGAVVRECLDCGYWDEDFTQKITDVATGKTSIRHWDRNNMLVEAKNGSVNRTMIAPGDSVILTPEKDGVHKFTGWTAKYEYQQEGEAIRRTVNVTLTCTEQSNGTWTCTIPTNFFAANGVLGGGKLTFTGTMDTAVCTHSSTTENVGYREARCLTDGYTGDTVCNDCGHVVTPGSVIKGGSAHEGELILQPDTAVNASCKTHGYEGDYKCSKCNGIVAGTRRGYVHNNKVTTGYVAPTCLTDGYTGDTVCNDCGKELGSGKVIPALKHDWDDGVKNAGVITTITYTCKRCGETYTRAMRENGLTRGEIKELKFTMSSNYTAGNRFSAVRVTESDARYNIAGDKVYFFKTINMLDTDKTFELADAEKGEIVEGRHLYLVIPVQAEDGYSFAEPVTAKLNNKTPGVFIADAEIKVPANGTVPATTVSVPVVVFDIGAPKAAPTVTKTYTLTVSDSMAENSGAGKYAKNAMVDINAGSKEGYEFDHWAIPYDLAMGNPRDSETTLAMPERSITVTAIWKLNHVHNYGTWRTSASQHWHECSDGSCPNRAGSVTEQASHVYDSDTDTTCNTCGYVRTVGHSHTYAWNKNADQHWQVCIDGDCPDQAGSVTGTAPHVYDSDTDTTCNTCGYVRTLYTVTVNGSEATTTGAGSYAPGTVVTINAGTKSGYTFSGWTTSDGVSFANASSASTTFTMPAKSVTVTANWTENSSGGGGGGVSTYTITVEDAKNGDVTADRKSASSGTTVTITVDPDKGYTLETLTVLDKNGKEVDLTNKGSGKYTFKMPASKVTVKATFAEDNSMLNFFVDVPSDAYYADAVLWAAENGITGGIDAVHFAPYATCTRAQIVTFLWRAAGSPEPKAASSFTDVSADAYYAKAVAWAVENGITGGIGGGKFASDATCTRAQAVTFLYRAVGSPAVSSNAAFSDVGTDAYYANAVAWAAKQGITGGIGDGLFGSDNDCTRAQIVTFLYRSIVK